MQLITDERNQAVGRLDLCWGWWCEGHYVGIVQFAKICKVVLAEIISKGLLSEAREALKNRPEEVRCDAVSRQQG